MKTLLSIFLLLSVAWGQHLSANVKAQHLDGPSIVGMKTAHLREFRMSDYLCWANKTPIPTGFTFKSYFSDMVPGEAAANGLSWIMVATTNNPAWDPTGQVTSIYQLPTEPHNRATWIAAVVDHVTRYRPKAVEPAWNEPDLRDLSGQGVFARPVDPVIHGHLLMDTADALKASGYAGTILGPCGYSSMIAQDSIAFFTTECNMGLLDHIDAVSLHYYPTPWQLQSLVAQVAALRRLLASYGHPNMPIWVTECGDLTSPSAAQSAPFVSQILTGIYGQGVDTVSVYGLKDYGANFDLTDTTGTMLTPIGSVVASPAWDRWR